MKVADATDVSRLVTLARENGVELAIRGGGHSGAGHSLSDGGIVLDLRDMKAVKVDVDGRTAWAEAGVTAAEYTAAAAEHGLATGFGDTGSVGLPGITLSGGIGFLVRKHGLAIDSLLAAEIVTADGEIRQVDEHTEPDLFWAIRGGGGNFGVVTRLKFQLHELDGIVGGMLLLPATTEVVERFIALAEAAPAELSTIANVMPAPPMPFVAEEWHGRLVVMALVVYAGTAEAGEQAIAPFRALATPIADLVKPMSYPEMFPPEDDSYHPTAVFQTMFVDEIGSGEAGTVMKFLEGAAGMRVAQLRVLGCAMADVPVEATAFAHRQSRIMVNVAAFYDGEADKTRVRHGCQNSRTPCGRRTPVPTSASLAMRGQSGFGRLTPRPPGTGWPKSRSATTRRTSSTSIRTFHRSAQASKHRGTGPHPYSDAAQWHVSLSCISPTT